ncbi:MAG: PQQ-dependent sugar dehydrogenase [Planctomycetales bacterium]|nr:PQQ-dependent sugar dehydrogenase [Planctomycetales bacterium]
MTAVDLCVFLTSYTLITSFVAIGELLLIRSRFAWIPVVATLTGIVATVVIGTYVDPARSFLETLAFLVQQRDSSAVVSAGLGVAAAAVWLIRLFPVVTAEAARGGRKLGGFVWLALSVISVAGVVACSQAFIWKELSGFQRDPPARMNVPGFRIEKIADLTFLPVRIATDDAGTVYVSYDYFEQWGTMGGAIVEFKPDESGKSFRRRIIADSTLLMRSYGLALRNGDIYVSRTGIHPRANQGKVTYENAGAITRLRDLDGDGYFEFADDLVTDIPGARGPDTMQQNNDICFASDGRLFVTTSSAANRSLEDHPWAGCVLEVSPDFSQVGVMAKGFRNPFGLVIGPDGELFLTDNDIDENPGDEINHIVRGEHYGHPYVVPNEPGVEAEGFREPIHISELESNFLGMAYATSPALPAEYRNCIYMADYMQNAILRVKLERDGDTYKVTSIDRFATVTTPVDIAVTPAGDFYLISRRTQNVYRIRPVK